MLRCTPDVLHRLGQYESGSADEFWVWLAQEHAGFGVLQKLKEHTEAEGAASGKVAHRSCNVQRPRVHAWHSPCDVSMEAAGRCGGDMGGMPCM